MFGTNHQPLGQDVSGTNWLEFISTETRLRYGCLFDAIHKVAATEDYRIGVYTFLMDCMIAYFFNCHPQVAVSEMVGDFPCQDELFEANAALAFNEIALRAPSGPLPRSPSDFISFLLRKPAPTSLDRMHENITAAHLRIVILGPLMCNLNRNN